MPLPTLVVLEASCFCVILVSVHDAVSATSLVCIVSKQTWTCWFWGRKVKCQFQSMTKSTKIPFLPTQHYASAGLCDSDVSVRTSVCHTPVLCLAVKLALTWCQWLLLSFNWLL